MDMYVWNRFVNAVESSNVHPVMALPSEFKHPYTPDQISTVNKMLFRLVQSVTSKKWDSIWKTPECNLDRGARVLTNFVMMATPNFTKIATWNDIVRVSKEVTPADEYQRFEEYIRECKREDERQWEQYYRC